MFLTLMAAFAEFESDRIGERVRDTWTPMLQKNGRKPGGRRAYGRESDGAIRATEAQAIREQIVAPFLAGLPVTQIARDLNAAGVSSASGNLWRHKVVGDMLKRPDLANLLVIDSELVEGRLDPIVDRETWDRVQETIHVRARGPVTRGALPRFPFLLSKPVSFICGCCGGVMFAESPRDNDAPKYQCRNRKEFGVDHCGMKPVSARVVDGAVFDVFAADLIDHHATLDQIETATKMVVADTRASLVQAEQEVARCDDRLARQKRRWRDGEITTDEFNAERHEIASDRTAAVAASSQLADRVAQLEADGSTLDAEAALVRMLDDVRDAVSVSRVDGEAILAARAAIARVVEAVVVYDDDLPHHARQLDSPDNAFLVGHGKLCLELVPREEHAVRFELDGYATVKLPGQAVLDTPTTNARSVRRT
jgi:hypothetical protein